MHTEPSLQELIRIKSVKCAVAIFCPIDTTLPVRPVSPFDFHRFFPVAAACLPAFTANRQPMPTVFLFS
jgi:hypothetical protein